MAPLSMFVPSALLFCIVIGAAILWSRTRRISTLAQLVASVLAFVGVALEQIRWLFVLPADQSMFAHVMRSDPMDASIKLAQLLGSVAFAVAYFCYATRPTHLTRRCS